MKPNRIILNILAVFIFINCVVYSQSVSLFYPNIDSFPTMSMKFYAFDQNDELVRNIDTSNFRIYENGVERFNKKVSCPLGGTPIRLSSVLTIDVSGSMAEGNPTRMSLAKSAANKWIEMLDLTNSECAITSFDNDCYLNCDLTQNKTNLDNAVNALTPMVLPATRKDSWVILEVD